MSKRTQKDSGEKKRVTAKSKPMMNLVSRCSARIPDVLSSAASASTGKTRHERQFPLSSWNEQHQRTGSPVLDAYSSSFSECNADKNWSSQEWKSDELMEVRTGRPVCEQPPGLFTEQTDKFIVEDNDMDSDTDAESDMSLESRSFLHEMSDRVRKIQDQSSQDANTRPQQTFFNMVNVYVFDIGSVCIYGKELPGNSAGASHDSPRTPNAHILGFLPSRTPPKFNEKRDPRRAKWWRKREKK